MYSALDRVVSKQATRPDWNDLAAAYNRTSQLSWHWPESAEPLEEMKQALKSINARNKNATGFFVITLDEVNALATGVDVCQQIQEMVPNRLLLKAAEEARPSGRQLKEE